MESYSYHFIEGWKQIDDPLPEQNQHEPWERYLTRCGYHSYANKVGNDIGWSVSYRPADDKNKTKPVFPYMVEIGGMDEGRLVFCRDFISATELMRHFAPLIIADLLTGAIEDLEALLENQREETERMHEVRRRQYAYVKS